MTNDDVRRAINAAFAAQDEFRGRHSEFGEELMLVAKGAISRTPIEREHFRQELRRLAEYRRAVKSFSPTDLADLLDQQEHLMPVQKILTPKGVCSFLNLKTARAISEGAEPKFSLNIIFDKAAQSSPEFANLQKAIDQVLKERWPAKLPAGLISPFHDCADKAGQYDGYKAGDIYISPWSKIAPGCINARKEDIIDWSEFYAGWIVRANVRPFAYDTAGKRGCSLLLESVQFLRPGTRLDGRKPAAEQFPDDGEGENEEEMV
jgi:hypothetical protein